ncbi:hypothetical protein G9A89_003016 [Geosiphon pyriformis]|nr:hypothetical protein G9A89_003016 [Geosiphon pyriformis]
MAYAPIAKIEKFTGEKDNVQVWLNDTIQADYFTVPQILNQFIHGLYSSILQHVCPLHLTDFQAVVTNVRDFEAAELKTNYVQAVNLVINESSKWDSKLKQFSDFINQKIEGLKIRHVYHYQSINYGNRRHVFFTIMVNKIILELTTGHITINHTTNLLNPNVSNPSTSYLPTAATSDISTSTNSNSITKFNPNITQKPKTENCLAKLEINNSFLSTNLQFIQTHFRIIFQNYLSFLVTSENTLTNNLEIFLKQMINNNISSATITNNKLLAAIFSFKIKKPTKTPFFNKTALNTKLITAIYTNAKINGQAIKLI